MFCFLVGNMWTIHGATRDEDVASIAERIENKAKSPGAHLGFYALPSTVANTRCRRQPPAARIPSLQPGLSRKLSDKHGKLVLDPADAIDGAHSPPSTYMARLAAPPLCPPSRPSPFQACPAMFPTTSSVIMATDGDSIAQVSMANSMGAWLLGCCVTFLLNGFLFHQAYQYFRESTSDSRYMKSWVTAVLVVETLISVLILYTAYFYLVKMYWDPSYFFTAKPVWSLCLLPIPGSLAALISQWFFVRRVWLFAPRFRIVIAISFFLQAGNFGSFTALAINMFKAKSFADASKWSWLATLGCGTQMIGDIMLTLTLIHVLHQSRTGMNKTDSMLEIMIAYAISTGAVGCIVHLLNVILSIVLKNVFIYGSILLILAKLYANTFLVALNTRKFLVASYCGTRESSAHHRSTSTGGRIRSSGLPVSHMSSTPTAIELKVVTEESIEYDPEYKYADKKGDESRDRSIV